MFLKAIFYTFALLEFVQSYDDSITISLHPDEIFNSFKSIVSSDYIQALANEFAAKAAAHMIREIKSKEQTMERDLNTRLRWKEMIQDNMKRDEHEPHMPEYVKEEAARINVKDDHEWSKFNSKKEHSKDLEEPVTKKGGKSSILNEDDAMTLMKDPSPDGDNFDDELTDTDQPESKIPVIGVMKINGVYYRRLLGMI